MRTRWILGGALILVLAGCGSPAPERPPLADAKAMMVEHVQPAAEVYWQAVQYISDEKGQREIKPQNDAEWDRTAQAAATLKKLAEDLKRPEYAASRGSDWMDYAQGMADVAGQAEAAAKAHDVEKVLDVGGTLYNVCSACHEVYMPSPAGLAPADRTNTTPAQ